MSVLHRGHPAGNGDAAARRRLAGEGQIRIRDDQRRQQLDDARHVKDDGAVGGTHGVAQTARPGISQVVNVINRAVGSMPAARSAATAARGAAPGAARPRKRREVTVGVQHRHNGVSNQVGFVVGHPQIP